MTIKIDNQEPNVFCSRCLSDNLRGAELWSISRAFSFALCGRPPVVGLSFGTSGPCRAATL